ncbi:hypothetical protein [Candidatus Bodocaedibacter vickermanii]|uniref:Uncharacterized protein n=1 Tax=Candidatus Bodocaedibacter vickermanii TaxID=2741701 RepID=A0A7L9RTK7_9PROT|nr:hypothetical protein CPBP_00473 [Candidatus Paracaedibacteraceae bacterium 'Lake Konstanz']
MKLKELLIYGVATGLLTGCSATSNDPELQSTEEAHNKVKELKIEQNPMIRYLFDHTAKAALMLPDPDLCGGSDELYGVLSNPIKKTIKSIWKALEKQGFSGYDVSLLETENVEWSASFNAVYTSMRSLAPPQTDNDFHSRFVEYLVNLTSELSLSKEYFPFEVTRQELKHTKTLFGLKYQGRLLTVVRTDEGTYEAVLADEFRPGAANAGSFYVPPKIDTDVPVTQAQIDEWNQVFIDALKEDPFFGKEMSTPTDTSGSTSALAALKGKSGVDATQFTVNGVAGSQVDLGLPVYVQLKGSVDQDKSTTGMTGLFAYKLGNSVLGVVQSYANSGAGFSADSRQLESSIVAAHSFGLMFVEGQFGSISTTDVNFNDWSGVRSQVRFGIDTPFGAPFVQLTHRNFGHTSDTAGYVGFEIANTEFKADTYAFSTSVLTKVGHHSVNGATGSIDWTAALNLNSGVAFTTNLTLGSALDSKAAFNLSLDR